MGIHPRTLPHVCPAHAAAELTTCFVTANLGFRCARNVILSLMPHGLFHEPTFCWVAEISSRSIQRGCLNFPGDYMLLRHGLCSVHSDNSWTVIFSVSLWGLSSHGPLAHSLPSWAQLSRMLSPLLLGSCPFLNSASKSEFTLRPPCRLSHPVPASMVCLCYSGWRFCSLIICMFWLLSGG